MAAPLDGVHVLDLSWVMVGPASARYLADLGADVIKVESSKRIDPVRTLGPFKDGKTGPERSLSYHNLNAGKRCVAIDIRRSEGREIVLRLVDWADIVLESFTPGVLTGIANATAYALSSAFIARVGSGARRAVVGTCARGEHQPPQVPVL